ncbi:N-acetyltransferase [Budvicia diplopodorum]|uniref:N-acetyltransferase n=1 Tax=Budvicia diplopodorum TaxID=1119056 RepID=UPI00135B028E|nr:N-acetyltransferase [Budvicia diplopodorum]
MIRQYQPQDLEPLMNLWLTTTTEAHPFIDVSHWRISEPLIRNVYLPAATTWVYSHSGNIDGFISVMEQQFVGALFVRRSEQGKGAGKALMRQAQENYPKLLLEVYQQNQAAVGFYQAMGFSTASRQPHPETHQITLIMQWMTDLSQY